MFRSACSLRSTQCAALIALATAAGISRIETASEINVDDSASKPTGTFSAPAPALHSTYYRFALQALAPWLHFFGADDRLTSLADVADPANSLDQAPGGFASPENAAALRPRAEFARFFFRNPVALPLSVFEHAFPFAVGPPLASVNSTPRAEGTEVPRDSAARRILSVRIAANAHLASLMARPTRRGNIALRGEPFPSRPTVFSGAVLPGDASRARHF